MDGLHILSYVENENSESENGKGESSLRQKKPVGGWATPFPQCSPREECC